MVRSGRWISRTTPNVSEPSMGERGVAGGQLQNPIDRSRLSVDTGGFKSPFLYLMQSSTIPLGIGGIDDGQILGSPFRVHG